MPDATPCYIAIDLKSFYASVECVERGFDPLATNLVVADESRTEKTICLAVSPSLKAYGVGGRARLFEVVRRVEEVNCDRAVQNHVGRFVGKSVHKAELDEHPDWQIDFIRAVPRMALYLEYSRRIQQIYYRFVAPADVHVYSVDEVFIDATAYLSYYKKTGREIAEMIIHAILKETGITATAGIGTNLYLCKVAMDVVAKHVPADKHGVRIAELDEMSYRRQLWDHRPLTDFWRVGRGIASHLRSEGIETMGQLARYSLEHEEALYRQFGVNAELLIDHAWGWEPCTMPYIKAYRPETNSFSSGQVLTHPYNVVMARVVVKEMIEAMSMNLLSKRLVTDQVVLTVGYDRDSLKSDSVRAEYHGEVTTDYYGRMVPKSAHGSITLPRPTSSLKELMDAVLQVFDRVVNSNLLVRRINISVNRVVSEGLRKADAVQLDLFTDYDKLRKEEQQQQKKQGKERRLQETVIDIKARFGKNAILSGTSFEEGATAKSRNEQIGGHKA